MANILKIESGTIRNIFNESDGKIYYSIIDSVGIVAKTTDARNYWKVLKNRLKKTQNQLVTECNQLKMPASDGKSYLTDVATADTIVKIVELISPDYIPNFWRYFDNDNQNLSKMHLASLADQLEVKIPVFENNVSYPHLDLAKEKNSVENEEENTKNVDEFSLLIDAYTTDNFIIIKAFTAGADPKNIFIQATENSITISGSRYRRNISEENYSVQELAWGKFSRTLTLPHPVKEKEIEVREEDDGFVNIKIPLLQKKLNPKVVRMRTI